ncbi:type III secretion needle MxiH like family protein [Lysobacter capsici]|nr:type III secretion needle MxiH like family protein [Lysobacter capsici]
MENDMSNDVNALFVNSLATQEIRGKTEDAKASGGKGWLYAIAELTGKLADKKADQMTKAIEGLPADAKPSDMLKTQAEVSEFQLMMNTFTNVVKTLGDSLGQASRKG